MKELLKKFKQLEKNAHTSRYQSKLILAKTYEDEIKESKIKESDISNTDYIILRLYVNKDELSSF